jgi:hypothetical protein
MKEITIVSFLNKIKAFCNSTFSSKDLFLCILGLGVQLIMFFCVPLYFGGSDPMDHLRNAFYLSGDKNLGVFVPWRPFGPAILWVLTGVTILKTWKILVLLHFLVGWLLPWLFYRIVAPQLKMTALFYAAVINIFGILAFYSPFLCPETIYWGLNIFLLCICCNYLLNFNSKLLIYLIPVSFVITTNFRPTAALMFYVFLISCLLKFRTKKIQELGKMVCIFFALNLLVSFVVVINGNKDWPGTLWAKNIYDRNALKDWLSLNFYKQNKNTYTLKEFFKLYEKMDISSNKVYHEITPQKEKWIKEKLERKKHKLLGFVDCAFYIISETFDLNSVLFGSGVPLSGRNLYGYIYYADSSLVRGRIHSLRWDPYTKNSDQVSLGSMTSLILEAEGLSTDRLKNAFSSAAKDFPEVWVNQPFWTGKDERSANSFLNKFYFSSYFNEGLYEAAMWDCMVRTLGLRFSNKAYAEAAKEILKIYPYAAFLFYDNFLNTIFLKQIGYLKDNKISWNVVSQRFGDLQYTNRLNILGDEFGNLQTSLMPRVSQTKASNFIAFWYSLSHMFFYIMCPLFLLGSLYLVGKDPLLSEIVLLNLGFYFANVIPLAIFGNFGSPRYDDTLKIFIFFGLCLLINYSFRKCFKCT